MSEDNEFLWRAGQYYALPLLDLVQEVPGPRANEAWVELTRREQAWRSCSDKIAELESAIKRLTRPRNTRRREWPDEGQEIHCWRAGEWEPHKYESEWSMRGHLWLPAPPPPEEEEETND